MNSNTMNTRLHPWLFLGLFALAPAGSHAAQYRLTNNRIAADFDATGLTCLALANLRFPQRSATLDVANDAAALTVNGERLDLSALKPTSAADFATIELIYSFLTRCRVNIEHTRRALADCWLVYWCSAGGITSSLITLGYK